ncbi:MAG: hypothetical protein JWO38_3619 [Gemmataceae bacterium]|jgi:hypothetical protein|nr:hypothetical protein [Gemmataceae bacterium]
MNTVTPAIQNLARRLIALEAARIPSDGLGGAAVRACEKLRVPLARLAGVAGFRSLLARAVALATAEVPWLDSVQVRPDGALEGFDAAGRQPGAVLGGEAGTAVVAHLLGLLVTFIGDPLTLALVRDAWPDAPVDETERRAEGQL